MKSSVLLTKEVEKGLNAQMNLENQASYTYLKMAAWADGKGYHGVARFLYAQSQEEREHMLKIIQYLIDVDRVPVVPVAKEDTAPYTSLASLFEAVMADEMQVSRSVYALVEECLASNDFATYQFLQWFVEEQREEEATVRKILDLFKIIEPQGLGLFTIDQEIGKLVRAK